MILTPHLKHLILVALTAVVILLVVWKVSAYEEGQSHDQKILAEEKLKNDLAIAKTQAAASAAAQSDLQAKLDAQTAATARLQADILRLRSDLAAQRDRDAALAPPELAVRWQGLIGKGTVTPAVGGILADDTASHETVSQLEELPVLRAEKTGIEAISAQKDQTILAAQTLIDSRTAELDTCKRTITDADAVCKAKLSEQAAKARKRSIIYAVGAFIGGILFGRKF